MQRGEQSAFREFDELYRDRMRCVIRQLLGYRGFSAGQADDAADDLVQEALMRVFMDIKGLRDPGAFEVWLGRICANVVADFSRSKQRRVRVRQADPDELEWHNVLAAARIVRQLETAPEVDSILKQLSTEEEALLRMHHNDGLSLREIAETTGLAPTAVKERLHTARIKAAQLAAGEPAFDLMPEDLQQPEETLSRAARRRQLAAAAEALLADYTARGELTTFTALDAEDFHAQG